MSYQYPQLHNRRGVIRISLFEILAVLYIAHNVMPAVGYYMPGIVYLGLFGLITVMLLPIFQYKAAWAISGMFAVSLLSLISRLISPTGSGTLYLYGELQVYLYGIIALRLIVAGDRKACRRMLAVIFAMYLITAITTVLGNDKYPQASRMLATLRSSDILYRVYTTANIGSFSFVYELVLLTPLLIYLTQKKEIRPVLGYILIAFVGVVVVATEYGMAVMLYFASLILLLFRKLTPRKLLILLLVVLIVFVVGAELVADLFEQLSLSVDNETLAERFLAVAEALRGEDELSASTGQSRIERYGESLQSFIDTAFLGHWGSGSAGGHSFVFDALGFYGLFGLVGLILIFITIYKLCLKPYRSEPFFPYLLWSCFLSVLLMILNPKMYSFIFLCVLPLFGAAFKTKERSEAT